VSTLSKIRDLPVSLAITVGASVSPAEASLSPTSLAVVSVPSVGVDAVLAKEVALVKTALAKGLLQRGFLGLRTDSPSLLVVKEASSSVKGSLVEIVLRFVQS
jgi:hypothetical protein